MGSKYFVYETTNLINGKKYRGAHSCKCENCEYLGSGKLLLKAISKYGKDSFERKILIECDSPEQMFKEEYLLVDESWVKRKDTYNVKVGGVGGWDYINDLKLSWNETRRKSHSESLKLKYAETKILFGGKRAHLPFKGRHHSEESKRRISVNNSMKLTDEVMRCRKKDLIECGYPRRGSVTTLSQKWNVSHTQVSRFIKQLSLA